MEAMESIGVPRRIVAFVMPTGYSFNLDGTTLYLSLAAVFVAQAAGVPLTFGEQLLMVFTLMLTSKGVAGVPRASLVILLATVASFNLPSWPVFIILGIDALMDMARTAVNVLGNCLNRVVNMVTRYRGAALPAAGALEDIDHPLLAHTSKLAEDLERLRQCIIPPRGAPHDVPLEGIGEHAIEVVPLVAPDLDVEGQQDVCRWLPHGAVVYPLRTVALRLPSPQSRLASP